MPWHDATITQGIRCRAMPWHGPTVKISASIFLDYILAWRVLFESFYPCDAPMDTFHIQRGEMRLLGDSLVGLSVCWVIGLQGHSLVGRCACMDMRMYGDAPVVSCHGMTLRSYKVYDAGTCNGMSLRRIINRQIYIVMILQ